MIEEEKIYTPVNWKPEAEGNTPVGPTNLGMLDEGINNLDNKKIGRAVIELLSVTDTAPTLCNPGDLYYNTTDKKIYESTEYNIWNQEGKELNKKYLYVDIENSLLYYYDGLTFKPYGDGGDGTINIVNDMNSQGDSDVANAKTVKEYVDDNTNRASKIVWNNPNPTSDFSTQEITLDSSFANYNAYEIVYKGWKGNLQMASTGIVPKTTGAIMYYLESSTVLGLRQSNASVNNKMNIGNASGTGMNNAYIIPQMVIAHYIKEM